MVPLGEKRESLPETQIHAEKSIAPNPVSLPAFAGKREVIGSERSCWIGEDIGTAVTSIPRRPLDG